MHTFLQSEYEFSHDIVIPDRERHSFYLSKQLFNYMISLFVETQSFSTVSHLCCQLWESCGSTRNFLSRQVVGKILLPFLFEKSHYHSIQSETKEVNLSSESLSCDHTYKYVKYFNVTDPLHKKKKVCTYIMLTTYFERLK